MEHPRSVLWLLDFSFYLRALVLGCRGEEFRGRNRCIAPLASIVFAALI